MRAAATGGADGAGGAGGGAAEDPARALMRLVTDGGGVCEGVTRALGGCCGLGSRRRSAVAAGETLITLPRSLALTYGPGSDPALLAMIAKVPEELWSVRLALALLAERAKGDASRWAPYIATLPASYPGCPIFWGAEDLKALQYPPLAAQVAKRCKFLLDFTKGELDVLGGEGAAADPFGGVSVDVNGLGWRLRRRAAARSARVARRSLAHACRSSTCATTPSTRTAPSLGRESGAAGALSVVAKRAVAEGGRSLCYGELPNDFLPWTTTSWRTPTRTTRWSWPSTRACSRGRTGRAGARPNLGRTSPHRGSKALEKLGLTDDRRLWSALRRAKSTLACGGGARSRGGAGGDLQGARSAGARGRGEIRALLVVCSSCSPCKASTPLEEDLEELKAAAAGTREMSAAQMNAARFRLGKKRVLLAAISVLTDELGQERHTQYLNLRDSQKAAPAGDGEKRPPRAATSKGFGKR